MRYHGHDLTAHKPLPLYAPNVVQLQKKHASQRVFLNYINLFLYIFF